MVSPSSFNRCGFKGQIDPLRLLYACNGNLEQSDYDKRTVAHLAAAENHLDVLDFLIQETNFNFDLKDRWGQTPLDELKDPQMKDFYQHKLKNRKATG